MINTSSSAETFGLPLNQSIAFANHKGEFKERLKKQQLKTLEPFAPLLKQFLEPGEEVLLTMRGCSPMSFMEQFTSGWMIYYIKRCVLVVTDRRILHFPARSNYSPRHSIAQIRFGDVDTITASTFLSRKFTVKYKNGKKEVFLYVKDTKKLKAVLSEVRMTAQQPTTFGIRHHLCPKCTDPLTIGEYLCPSCKLEFKSEKKARNLSILYPGGGYFYTGHPFMGIGDAIVETLLIVMVLASFVNLISGAEGDAGLPVVILFGIILFIEKLYTVFHAKHYVREYIPVDKEIQPLRR
ncbi:MAG: hypothetical protein AABZ15_05545 [Nitrospirota bacterium]